MKPFDWPNKAELVAKARERFPDYDADHGKWGPKGSTMGKPDLTPEQWAKATEHNLLMLAGVPCCDKEKRDWNGWCQSCGCPCF